MAKQQYGITVSSKDGARSATEWFTSEVERDQFYAWYTDHKRACVRVQRDDEQALAKEREDQRQHELNVAHAGRSSYRGGDTYSNFSSGASTGLGAGVGLALGVALGGLF